MPRAAGIVLGAGALLCALLGAGGLLLGLLAADWLTAQLPELEIDSAAVGGAASALGIAFLAAALVQVALVVGLARRVRWADTAAVLASASLGMVAAASAVAAGVSAAAGGGLGLGLGAALLTAIALAYLFVAARLVAARRAI